MVVQTVAATNENPTALPSLVVDRGKVTMSLIHMQHVELTPFAALRNDRAVTSRQLQQIMQIAMLDPPAQVLRPNRLDLVPELTQREDRLPFGSRRT